MNNKKSQFTVMNDIVNNKKGHNIVDNKTWSEGFLTGYREF